MDSIEIEEWKLNCLKDKIHQDKIYKMNPYKINHMKYMSDCIIANKIIIPIKYKVDNDNVDFID